MNEVFIRGIVLPYHVRGITIKDENGDFNIYINSNLCPCAQQEAIEHEMRHVKLNHLFDDTSVYSNEFEANS